MEKPHVAALKRAISVSGGTQAAFAKRIAEHMNRPTFGQQTVSYWLTNETLLDPDYWAAIEAATNNLVTRHDLRPDVFCGSNAA